MRNLLFDTYNFHPLILCDFVFNNHLRYKLSGHFRKPSGAIVSGQSLACEIEIMQGNISGELAYAERHSVITNQQGIANFVIGQGFTTTGVFSDIDWGNGPFYMKLYLILMSQKYFPNATIWYTATCSVPYALHTSGGQHCRWINNESSRELQGDPGPEENSR